MTGRPAARRFGAALLVLGLVVGACSSDDADEGSSSDDSMPASSEARPADQRGGDVALPEVSGPVTGGLGEPSLALSEELADQYGYVEEEFFLAGEATSYVPEGELVADGEWAVTPAESAPYATRVLVRRPADPTQFDGTVFVEWFNVTGGIDNDPLFSLAHPAMLREGSVWVGVTAQQVGVEGGGPGIPIEGAPPVSGLVGIDPERYGELDHPGDAFSYDIYSQAAQAIRQPGEVDVLDGLVPEQVIAVGQSQSAARMVTYVDAIHPLADIYDGFLIHSRGASGASLTDDPEVGLLGGGVAQIRTDTPDPVLQFETETDVVRGFVDARQDDSDTIRTWEVAGTAHADQAILDYNAELAASFGFDISGLCPIINDGPMDLVLRAAVAALRTWVVDGEAPASALPLETEGSDIVRAEDGIALGGVRSPAVDAPTTILSGEPVPGTTVICSLFGNMEPIPAAELAERYPTHEDYVEAVTTSADEAVAEGWLLEEERDQLVADAEDADVPPA